MEAVIWAHEDLKQAYQRFREQCIEKDADIPADVPAFVHRWWKRYKKDKTMSNKKGRGAKSDVDLQLLDDAELLFTTGYITEAGRPMKYETFKEAAQWDCKIKELVAGSGLHERAFFDHLLQVGTWASSLLAVLLCSAQQETQQAATHQQACPLPCLQRHPTVEKVPEVAKFQLSEAHRQERREVARQLLQFTEEQRHSMVFVDSATKYVCGPKHTKVWVNTMREPYREQIVERPDYQEKDPMCLRWYIAIAPYHNRAVLHLVTGTTDYPTEYHVSFPRLPVSAT